MGGTGVRVAVAVGRRKVVAVEDTSGVTNGVETAVTPPTGAADDVGISGSAVS